MQSGREKSYEEQEETTGIVNLSCNGSCPVERSNIRKVQSKTEAEQEECHHSGRTDRYTESEGD